MGKMATKFGFFALAAAVAAGTGLYADEVDVTPSAMGNWYFLATDSNATPCSDPSSSCSPGISGQMVSGPATPPIGQGSAELSTLSGSGDGASRLDNATDFNGITLNELTALSYSTYDVTNNGQQFPYLKLAVALPSGVHGGTDDFFFEPPYQTTAANNDPSLPDQGATALNTWQTWDAMSGGWWDDYGTCNPGASGPGTQGVCSLSTLESLLGVSSSAVTINLVSLRVGYASPGNSFQGNVDNLTVGVSGLNTTYDFEQDAAAPEPGTFLLLGGGLLASLIGKRRLSRTSKTNV